MRVSFGLKQQGIILQLWKSCLDYNHINRVYPSEKVFGETGTSRTSQGRNTKYTRQAVSMLAPHGSSRNQTPYRMSIHQV
mmetsp:Transcript_18687/g.27904  ORF Transcript_18687/g.27904 Transcript_18687/m.27904 type:complete len:80 (-) Transcript_18687:354-593(-)